ncbi:MAG TPA: hypothetical protein VH255_02435 [Verrucomicrobiae bacterium]|nr:hypothetical protein [Verrucomicrobiae bacterium]
MNSDSKAMWIFLLVLVGGIGYGLYSGWKTLWQFRHLEENARAVVTASELQTWATNLLVRHPEEGHVRSSELGADFPKQLRSLASKVVGPIVYIHQGDGTNWPSSVQMTWGSGFLGAHGFEIGPTNFTGLRSKNRWQPGVYFY